MQANKWLPTHLEQQACSEARSDLPELPNTVLMVEIHLVSNSNDNFLSPH